MWATTRAIASPATLRWKSTIAPVSSTVRLGPPRPPMSSIARARFSSALARWLRPSRSVNASMRRICARHPFAHASSSRRATACSLATHSLLFLVRSIRSMHSFNMHSTSPPIRPSSFRYFCRMSSKSNLSRRVTLILSLTDEDECSACPRDTRETCLLFSREASRLMDDMVSWWPSLARP